MNISALVPFLWHDFGYFEKMKCVRTDSMSCLTFLSKGVSVLVLEVFANLRGYRVNELSTVHCSTRRRAINLDFERSPAETIPSEAAGDSNEKVF